MYTDTKAPHPLYHVQNHSNPSCSLSSAHHPTSYHRCNPFQLDPAAFQSDRASVGADPVALQTNRAVIVADSHGETSQRQGTGAGRGEVRRRSPAGAGESRRRESGLLGARSADPETGNASRPPASGQQGVCSSVEVLVRRWGTTSFRRQRLCEVSGSLRAASLRSRWRHHELRCHHRLGGSCNHPSATTPFWSRATPDPMSSNAIEELQCWLVGSWPMVAGSSAGRPVP